MPADHYDVIVVGSGPGRASLPHRLAPTGKRILMLERGNYLHRSRSNWDFKAVFVDVIGGTAHQAGTRRFGTDPASSVLNLDCKAHELDNLYVADASFFPSIAAVNPTLTIIADALRVGDRIKERLRA